MVQDVKQKVEQVAAGRCVSKERGEDVEMGERTKTDKEEVYGLQCQKQRLNIGAMKWRRSCLGRSCR